ncbi:MAG: glycosyltransferase family 2 protein [Solirubrobacterales bacterium]
MSGAQDLIVDIVIDNYNYGAYLGEAIESACRQSHPNVNVIVVDDGSTDNSRAVLAHYEDRVQVVLKENGGQASALNAGMAICEGDIVIFLDADDVLRPQAAALVAAAFAADRRVAKTQFRMDVIDAEGRPSGAIKPPPHMRMPSGDLRGAELAYPYDLTWLAMSANAFRSAALAPIFPIPERDFRICADWYLVHLGALLGTVASIEELGASYRLHGANNYEPQAAELDLDHIRETIGYARATSPALLALAGELGLPHPARILSIADLANRMISLRLDRGRHPLPTDTTTGLLADSVRATRRRSAASAALKLAFIAWFAAMALAPAPAARRLAEVFLFPERRMRLNPLLGRLQRRGESASWA